MPAPRIIAGAMSGTSADGVDVALVHIEGRGLQMSARLIRHHHLGYEPALRKAIFDCRSTGQIRLADLAAMGREISVSYAHAVNQAIDLAGLTAKDVTA